MKTLELTFREQDADNFNRIKSGEKLIETRAGSPEYLEISSGDELVITCGTDTITKLVKEVYHFASLHDLIEKIGIEEILPAETTPEEAIAKWNSFPGYPERIQEFGIIAWALE